MKKEITVIGAGLAGSEAAWQLLTRGYRVRLIDMRPGKQTPAHHTGLFGELVCSNSLRSDDADNNAVGLLHAEMRALNSLIMTCADATRIPAGGALAVNRDDFAHMITETLKSHPNLAFENREAELDLSSTSPVILATGPLTSDKIADQLKILTQSDSLHFFDAIAPIVHTESIDMSNAWYQSRYDKGDGTDYLNCPLTQSEYETFVDALIAAPKIEFKEWEKNTPYFEGCLPVEVMATRGRDTLRYGPMKPVGLLNPREFLPDGRLKRPYAVVQLRRENAGGTLMNMVGFQTKMTYGAQKDVLKLIPALKNAEFARLGGIHRNTFVCGPRVLDDKLSLKSFSSVRLAGQITGCEGYVESASVGLLAGLFTALPDIPIPPSGTAIGALLNHITHGNPDTFQPMNVNFGLFPPLSFDRHPRARDSENPGSRKEKPPHGRDRKQIYTAAAKLNLQNWITENKI